MLRNTAADLLSYAEVVGLLIRLQIKKKKEQDQK